MIELGDNKRNIDNNEEKISCIYMCRTVSDHFYHIIKRLITLIRTYQIQNLSTVGNFRENNIKHLFCFSNNIKSDKIKKHN